MQVYIEPGSCTMPTSTCSMRVNIGLASLQLHGHVRASTDIPVFTRSIKVVAAPFKVKRSIMGSLGVQEALRAIGGSLGFRRPKDPVRHTATGDVVGLPSVCAWASTHYQGTKADVRGSVREDVCRPLLSNVRPRKTSLFGSRGVRQRRSPALSSRTFWQEVVS